MITMDVKGITWVGNIYQKFENMCLEAEDMMYEDTAEYIENQMQSVGASVKKLYSDIVGDLLPSIACGLHEKEDSELPADQCIDAGLRKKPVNIFKERPAKANIKQTTKDSRIDKNADNDSIHDASYDGTCKTDVLFKSSSRNSVKKSNFISRSRQYVGCMDIKSNLGVDENRVNEKLAATKISNEITSAETKIFNEITSAETKVFNEITSAETDTCRTLQRCEVSNEDRNQNHGARVSKPASAEVARLASEADHCNEIENACTEQFPYVLVQVKSAEEKQIGMSSPCGPFGKLDDFSTDKTIQSDDYSNSMVVLSYPEQGKKSMQEDHLKLEESCVMVTGDDLEEISNLKTNKKIRRRQGFSLSKKSARKQEYEELAIWHRNNCLDMVNNNLDKTLNQKKLLLPSVSESEWELL